MTAGKCNSTDPSCVDSVDIAPCPLRRTRTRRGSVSSETGTKPLEWLPPSHPKSESDRTEISAVMTSSKMGILFNHLGVEESDTVISAFHKKSVAKGEKIIRQGDEGDFFYIVHSGDFEITVKQGGSSETVQMAGPGSSFGELALMYNAPRAATCEAMRDSIVWALDRETFRVMCVTSENTKTKKYELFLRNLEIFKGLSSDLLSALASAVSYRIYSDGDVIISEGENGQTFYVVEEGSCVRKERDSNMKETVVEHHQKGGHFGEYSLMHDGPGKASVYAVGRTGCLAIDKATFESVLGPIGEVLKTPPFQCRQSQVKK